VTVVRLLLGTQSVAELLVVDPGEVDDDLVGRGMTEILTSLCARLYGEQGGANRAARAVAVLGQGDRP
jgi:predicted site-specific integrase-resolvase